MTLRSGRSPRITRIALGVGLLLGGLAFATNRAEARTSCSDYTIDHRDCTGMEQLGHCFTNTMTSYRECAEDSGFWAKLGCGVAYEFDFYWCTPSTLLSRAMR